MNDLSQTLPLLLAGPILRHVSSKQISLWLVTSEPVNLHVQFFQEEKCIAQDTWGPDHKRHVQIGDHAHIHLLQIEPETPFPTNEWISYDIGLETGGAHVQWLLQTAPQLFYADASRPDFVIKTQIDQLMHGSCRNPHHTGGKDADALLVLDQLLEKARLPDAELSSQPALLLFTGDQIYADDVAGPMLRAIHQVTAKLGLFDEAITGATVADSSALYVCENSYYNRSKLLPDTKGNSTLKDRFFGGVRKPIFTTANADNHLITAAEFNAMYLLIWSPVLWRFVDLNDAPIAEKFKEIYQTERIAIEYFSENMDRIQRALAHVPVYMMFDDHDVTDDWNLTRGWEESAYAHPFARRIIGNALIAYSLFQAWGNRPDALPDPLLNRLKQAGNPAEYNDDIHNTLITELLAFEGWHYTVDTQPKLVVLDTRTRRWRSERDSGQPSGLMDWEALSELQQQLIGEDSVILLSGSPIFGVKIVEVIQRIFTWFGHALTVDAENWMAHPGAANVILNIFRHKQTPHHFVILSGDVHYSFAYDVRLRSKEESPHIWQICSSGVKNTFPDILLPVFDRLNRWLFSVHSPLNWFTRRRHMRIRPRRPSSYNKRYKHQRLVNGCNIGRVFFDSTGKPTSIEVLMTNGETIAFTKGYESDWVH